MVGSATRTGLALSGLAVGVYYFTIYHLKQQAPGNLDEMVRACVIFNIKTNASYFLHLTLILTILVARSKSNQEPLPPSEKALEDVKSASTSTTNTAS